MLLREITQINEMAVASPWTTFVRKLILDNPNITNNEINALVNQNNITPPNYLNVRIDGLRKSIAKQSGTTAPTITKSPKQASTPKSTPKATPAATVRASGDGEYMQKIGDWLKTQDIANYTIDPNTYVVDVVGEVQLGSFHNTKLPVKFGTIDGDFIINGCGLTTLENCPNIVKGRFACHHNKALKSAVGGPEYVYGSADFENCPLTSIAGLPREVHGDLDLSGTKITSFAGIHKIIKLIDGRLHLGRTGLKITDSIAGLILIRKLTSVESDFGYPHPITSALSILNKHLEGDRSGVDCQIEMQDAGLSNFAKL